MVAEGMADIAWLKKSPPRLPEDRLMTLVAGIHPSNSERTLREIASQLERLHERTRRGGTKWSPSSVKNLINRARRSSTAPGAARTSLTGYSFRPRLAESSQQRIGCPQP